MTINPKPEVIESTLTVKAGKKSDFERAFFDGVGVVPYEDAFKWNGNRLEDFKFVDGMVFWDNYCEKLFSKIKDYIEDGYIKIKQHWVDDWEGVTVCTILKNGFSLTEKEC